MCYHGGAVCSIAILHFHVLVLVHSWAWVTARRKLIRFSLRTAGPWIKCEGCVRKGIRHKTYEKICRLADLLWWFLSELAGCCSHFFSGVKSFWGEMCSWTAAFKMCFSKAVKLNFPSILVISQPLAISTMFWNALWMKVF